MAFLQTEIGRLIPDIEQGVLETAIKLQTQNKEHVKIQSTYSWQQSWRMKTSSRSQLLSYKTPIISGNF